MECSEWGVTIKGAQLMISMINQYHRSMARSPVHFTRENTSHFFARFHINPPWIVLQNHYQRFIDSLSHAKSRFQFETMQISIDDVTAKIPDYVPCIIPIPVPIVDPCAQVGPWK